MKKLLLFSVVLVSLLAVSARAEPSPIDYAWWGPDGYFSVSYTTVDTYEQTGYWWGSYDYYWPGYYGSYWPAYSGWVYYNQVYSLPYWQRYGFGWYGPSWWYGFTDLLDYTSTISLQMGVWSWYVHEQGWGVNYGHVWDIYTGVNGAEVVPLSLSVTTSVTWSPHYFYYDPLQYYGQFSPVLYCVASPAAITSLLTLEGADANEINGLLNSQLVEDAIANNDNGLGSDDIGIQMAIVPEPTTFALLGIGAIGLLGCIRRRSKA